MSSPELKRLIKRYRINFLSPQHLDDCQSQHKPNFDNVKRIGDFKFDSFSASIDIRSAAEPWREKVKYRAEWLASRASSLYNQERNEAGWRFGLENDVLLRLHVEVACQKCRARLWRSEVEAATNNCDSTSATLRERRNCRRTCECPPNDRPQDYYETGTNPLFEDRTQEVLMRDPLLSSQLPKQQPDRIYGLQCTKNFEQALSEIMIDNGNATVGDTIKCSPFDEAKEPLLFPFLILEAKSESSNHGFGDIQNQTAFPIYRLLKLQEDLQAHSGASEPATAPLVWFLANRGDNWRVYGCFMSQDEGPRYNILQLWDGSIMSKDGALQLLLIVDYIFDWARDIYRPCVLRQLKSLASEENYDQITIAADSDIFSTRRRVGDWIRRSPSTTDDNFEEDESSISCGTLSHQDQLPFPNPNTMLGTVRSAFIVKDVVFGVCITEYNVEAILDLATRKHGDASYAVKAARDIVSFLARWQELIVLTGTDIDLIDSVWTGESKNTDDVSLISTTERFYFLAEYATYTDTSWNLIRRLSYIAVSTVAFNVLKNRANYKIKHPGINSIPLISRPCDTQTLVECLNCLQSGTPEQVLKTALARSLLSIYSVPERKRRGIEDCPKTEALGFGFLRRPRLNESIEKLHKLLVPRAWKRVARVDKARRILDNNIVDLTKDTDTSSASRPLSTSTMDQSETKDIYAALASLIKSKINQSDAPSTSFTRILERRSSLSDNERHEVGLCKRCLNFRSCTDETPHHVPPHEDEMFHVYGIALVIASNTISPMHSKHDICVFISNVLPEICDRSALATVVDDLLKADDVYQTIHGPDSKEFKHSLSSNDKLWNLPRIYRAKTAEQQDDALDWVEELGLKTRRNDAMNIRTSAETSWDRLQVMLHFLSIGQSYQQAEQSDRDLDELYCRQRSTENGRFYRERRSLLYHQLGEAAKAERTESEANSRERAGPRWLASELSTKGDPHELPRHYWWN